MPVGAGADEKLRLLRQGDETFTLLRRVRTVKSLDAVQAVGLEFKQDRTQAVRIRPEGKRMGQKSAATSAVHQGDRVREVQHPDPSGRRG